MSLTREEFEDVLETIFYGLCFPIDNKELQRALITNEKSLMDQQAINYLRAIERIQHYLTEWDNAPDQTAKDAVVGSVSGDLGSATVDPENAYNWPPGLGHFGDVKGPLDLEQFSVTKAAMVNGTSTGNTPLFTVPAGKRFIPQCGGFTLMNVTGLALVATMSIGSNASSYNNVIGSTLLTGLSSQNQHIKVNLSGLLTTIAAEQEIYCRVSIASTATTYDVLANVSGFLVDA